MATRFPSDAGATLIVTASDPCLLLAGEDKVASWPDQADSDIVEAIVGGYAIAVQTEPTGTVHAAATTTIVQRGSDLAFVRRLARRNGYEFYVEADDSGTPTAYFQPPQLDGTPQKTLAIQFGEDTNLRSFSTKLTGRKPLAVKTAQLDAESGSVNAATVTDASYTALGATDAATLIGGPLGSLVTPAENAAEMRVLGPPSADATELQTLAQAVRDEASWILAASGEVNAEAYGSVLRPHRTVLIKGAGKPYSGEYYVVRVVHELTGAGDWIQRFEALRNARDVHGRRGLRRAGRRARAAGAAVIDDVVAKLVDRLESRYFGKYRGQVTDNDDPSDLGRVKATVPRLLDDVELGWALPAFAYGGIAEQGFFAVPDIGAGVWIEFEEGDLSYPIWTGTWYQSSQIPESAKPAQKVLKTASGHKIVLDDDAKSITITDANGNVISMDGSDIKITAGNATAITIDGPSIVLVDGASEPLVLGNQLQQYLSTLVSTFNAHMHPGQASPVGPVTPAPPAPTLQPPTPSLFSQKVKTQ